MENISTGDTKDAFLVHEKTLICRVSTYPKQIDTSAGTLRTCLIPDRQVCISEQCVYCLCSMCEYAVWFRHIQRNKKRTAHTVFEGNLSRQEWSKIICVLRERQFHYGISIGTILSVFECSCISCPSDVKFCDFVSEWALHLLRFCQ